MPFTAIGIHHVGVAVRDIQRSLEWYSTMFDLTPAGINQAGGPEMSRALQVPDASLALSMVQIGNARIEFLQYHEPRGEDFDRSNADVGSMHVCIEVDDVDAAYRELQERGAAFNAEPRTLEQGPRAGSRWVYLRDPDGIQLELWQSPAT
jgi:catechol 2,3-dioxygenase-like lactoylglutathione lyase family enzyme